MASTMSRSGLSCLHSSNLPSTASSIPNLPGARRSIASTSPAIWKQHLATHKKSETADPSSSVVSYFEQMETGSVAAGSSAAAPPMYPSSAGAFNDIQGRYSLRSQHQDRLSHSRSLPFCRPDTAPSFVLDNMKVCKFTGFFTEKLRDHGIENERSRMVEISFFLEDSTIEILEPRIPDSGLVQGKLLKRHQISRPYRPGKGGLYALEDFFAGAVLNIYNVIYTVNDCDERTYNYLKSMDQPFGNALSFPSNCQTARRPPPKSSRGSGTGNVASRTAASAGFFEYDRKVLRFYCIWDNRSMLFGDRQQVRLHYYLADNTMELCQVSTRNNGRDMLPKFLKKLKVPYVSQEEMNRPITGSLTTMSTTDPENSNVGQRYYHWSDLRIGDTIRIASIDVKILDADGFTREFTNSHGCRLGDSIVQQNVGDGEQGTSNFGASVGSYGGADILRLSTAGPNGGLEDDSFDSFNLASSPNALPGEAPLSDSQPNKLGPPFTSQEIRTAFNTQHLSDVRRVVLRFVSRIQNGVVGDDKRSFIIQIHLEDNTLQIREPPSRNSGYKGGVFLKRTKMTAEQGIHFMPEDCHLGCTLKILAHQFVICDADEHTLHYMESMQRSWPFSSPSYLKDKLQSSQDSIKKAMLMVPNLNTKYVDRDALFEFIQRSSGINLNIQEVVTLFRTLDVLKTGKVKLSAVVKFIQSSDGYEF